MHKLNGIIAGITIRGLTSPARPELGEPRDVSLRILFAQSIVMPQYLPMGAHQPERASAQCRENRELALNG